MEYKNLNNFSEQEIEDICRSWKLTESEDYAGKWIPSRFHLRLFEKTSPEFYFGECGLENEEVKIELSCWGLSCLRRSDSVWDWSQNEYHEWNNKNLSGLTELDWRKNSLLDFIAAKANLLWGLSVNEKSELQKRNGIKIGC